MCVRLCTQVTFTRPVPHRHRKRTTKVGLVLPPSPAALNRDVPVGEASGRHGAALMYEWETGRLEMVSVCVYHIRTCMQMSVW